MYVWGAKLNIIKQITIQKTSGERLLLVALLVVLPLIVGLASKLCNCKMEKFR